jgi:hypothetical protein
MGTTEFMGGGAKAFLISAFSGELSAMSGAAVGD